METYRGAVYPWHCDHMGHMNVMWYVGKFDEATWQLFGALGVTAAYLRAAGRGMAAVDQRISYLRELHAGDIVCISSRVLEVNERSLLFEHEMRDAATQQVVARTTIKGVHIDSALRKSCGFEAAVADRARGLIRAEDGA